MLPQERKLPLYRGFEKVSFKEEEDEILRKYLKWITASKIAFEQDKLEIKIVHEIV